jgi:hypothetical protein
VHLRPSPRLGCSSTSCGKRLQFNVKRVIFQKFHATGGTSYNSSPLFMHFMHLSLLYYTIVVIMKVMSQSSHLPWELSRWSFGGALFALTHFKALCSTTNHFPSCLFPSMCKWHSHHRSPFNCIICLWTFLDQIMCDRSFYPTS